MSSTTPEIDDALLARSLELARDTKMLLLGPGVRRQIGEMFGRLFAHAPCVIVADDNTFDVLGSEILDLLRRSGRVCDEPIILPSDDLYAEFRWVDQISESLARTEAIPVAVGAGTVNDLTKLAAHRRGRRYLSIATAASMDGYTAYGASITYQGSKQTFDCPAPLGVVADLEIIATAPPALNAAGYADLIAKCPAGADWILADALGEEAIDPTIWEMVQSRLRFWMENPLGVRSGDIEVLRRLTLALMMSGFAMQAACTSRPASGAEHQFSHLWDMEHHKHHGYAPSHGFKVGVASVASLAMYEAILEMDLQDLDIGPTVDQWPSREDNRREVKQLFSARDIREKAVEESDAKYIAPQDLRGQLERLARNWRTIRGKLSGQVLEAGAAREMLSEAGCPTAAPQIGISLERLRESFLKSYHLRRRFTILDVVRRAGVWEESLDATIVNPSLRVNS